MKIANIRQMSGTVTIREPYTTGKFYPATHFLPHEESNFLNSLMPYEDWFDVVTDDVNYLEHINIQGYLYHGERYRAIFVIWRDNVGKAICVPARSGIKNLADLGVFVHLNSLSDCGKVGKYVNRIFAPLPKGKRLIHGKANGQTHIQENGNIFLAETYLLDNGQEIQVIFDDISWMDSELRAAVDGAIAIGPEAAVALELTMDPKLGDAWRGTFGTPQGLGKGHLELIPRGGNQVRIFGPKLLVKTEHFTFGSMGPLHAGLPHTDAQAYWNFDFDRPELAPALARRFMKLVFEATKNEDQLREVFLRYTFNAEQSEAPDLEGWILRKALALNIPILSRETESGVRVAGHPGLYRRVVRYLMKKVMDCEKARIPMDSVAVYGYVLPDPFIFQENLRPDLTFSRIDDGQVVMPDLAEGLEVVAYRQPSENDNAHAFLETVMSDGFKAFRGKGICILGRGARKVLARLGGGDMDDMFVIVFDPIWVNAFRTLQYPETEKLVATSSKVKALYEDEEFFSELASTMPDRPKPGEYGSRQFTYQIEQARKAGVGIGPVVNMGGIDKLLSSDRHRLHIIDTMPQGLAPSREQWFLERKPYQAAKYMTNLELVIDGNVKDETLLQVLGDVTGFVKKFHEDLQMYPKCMVNRIPASKLKRGDYTLVETLMCKSLSDIASMRDILSEMCVEQEWLIAGPADTTVLEYWPVDKEVKKIVTDLRTIWREEWAKRFEAGVTEEDRNQSFSVIEKKIEAELAAYPSVVKTEIAVELYRQVYRRQYPGAKIDEKSGRRRTFPDSLLWTQMLGNTLLDAFREVEKAGLTVGVELMPEFRRLQRGQMQIRVLHGGVLRMANQEQIGWVSKAPDGEYTMKGGVITVKECTLGL